jgi:hypothetical protein
MSSWPRALNIPNESCPKGIDSEAQGPALRWDAPSPRSAASSANWGMEQVSRGPRCAFRWDLIVLSHRPGCGRSAGGAQSDCMSFIRPESATLMAACRSMCLQEAAVKGCFPLNTRLTLDMGAKAALRPAGSVCGAALYEATAVPLSTPR